MHEKYLFLQFLFGCVLLFFAIPSNVAAFADFFSDSDETSGMTARNNDSETFIRGGIKARKREFPYIVAIFENFEFICGGTLVDKDMVITSAHCVVHDDGIITESLSVQSHRILDTNAQYRFQARPVKKTVVHPNYLINNLTHFALNDIAILFLTRDFDISEELRTISLPSVDLPPNTYESGMAIGWGKISPRDKFTSDTLMKVQLGIQNRSFCEKIWNQGFDYNLQFCIQEKNKNICNGDSGGPFLVGSWQKIFYGIVSYGRSGCPTDKGGVLTRVSPYVPWIENTKLNFDSENSDKTASNHQTHLDQWKNEYEKATMKINQLTLILKENERFGDLIFRYPDILFLAIDNLDEDSVKLIIELNQQSANAKNDQLQTPLIRASLLQDKTVALRMIKFLIDNGANAYEKDQEGYTFLHRLVDDGTNLTPGQLEDLTKYLSLTNLISLFNLRGSFKKDLKNLPIRASWDRTESTPLQSALLNLEITTATLATLKTSGVNFNNLDGGREPDFVYAIWGGRSPRVLKDLVELGVNLKYKGPYREWRMLHQVAVFGNLDQLRYALTLGEDINGGDYQEVTPLHEAIWYRNKDVFEVVKLMLENGAKAKVNHKIPGAERSPIAYAKERTDMKDQRRILKLLESNPI